MAGGVGVGRVNAPDYPIMKSYVNFHLVSDCFDL